MKRAIFVLTFISYVHHLHADVYGKSFLIMRPNFELCFPERIVGFRDRAHAREDGHDIAFQIVGFGGQTTNASALARYFLPNDRDYIIVGEDACASAVNNTRDVNAAHFSIFTPSTTAATVTGGFAQATFESRVDFCPQQRVLGIGFTLQQRFKKNWWWDAAFPIIRIKNTLGLRETIYNAGGNGAAHEEYAPLLCSNFICAAGCNGKRLYGNMVPGWMTKWGVPQVELRVGSDLLTSACAIGSYVGLSVATGNKPCARMMFEPIIGNSGHWAALLGWYGAIELMRDSFDRTFNAVFTSVTRFFAPNTQRRSFDLRGKPWSRYMLVWTRQADPLTDITQVPDNLTQLINYSTMCVSVHPHYAYDFNIGCNYKTTHFRGEVGYNLYARCAEDIYFNQPMKGDIGIAAVKKMIDTFVPASTPPHTLYTNSLATIASPMLKLEVTNAGGRCDEAVNINGVNTTCAYIPITIDDIDATSGAYPGTVSQTIYAALDFAWEKWTYPFFCTLGSSYEFASNNSTINRWIVWLKLGMSI